MDIGNSFEEATDGIFGFLPNLLGFLLILLIGFVVAKVVSTVARKALEKAGLDRRLHESEAHNYVEKVMPGASPSNGIATVVFWLIFVFFIFSAIGALQIPALTTFMNQVLAYLPNVIVAIFIFVLASLVAGGVAAGVGKVMGDTPTGKIVATIVPAIVMVIAMFMILEQLQIAPEIVRIAFAATMGALALGLALAFGLGGRGVAQQMLEDAYAKGREQRDQVKADVQQGRERAEHQARQADPTRDDAGSSAYASQGAHQGAYGQGADDRGVYDQGGYQGTPAPYDSYDHGAYEQGGTPSRDQAAAPYDTSGVETQQFDPRNQ
jgi:small-conductance mechanosensitive channel